MPAQHIQKNHAGWMVFSTIIFIGIIYLLPPIAQDPHYHSFADTRRFMGIPNFLNVISNVPFIIVGLFGIYKISTIKLLEYPRQALYVFFISVLLTGLGSSWYHLQPNNLSLVWDRLPMAMAFMSLLSAIISLHMEEWAGKMLLVPFLLLGVGSVGYWYYTETIGHGDLRPYLFVQFYPMILIPMIMFLYPAKNAIRYLLLPIIGFYAVAKYFEFGDHDFFAFGNLVSGHTMKHLFAALACASILKSNKIYASA